MLRMALSDEVDDEPDHRPKLRMIFVAAQKLLL